MVTDRTFGHLVYLIRATGETARKKPARLDEITDFYLALSVLVTALDRLGAIDRRELIRSLRRDCDNELTLSFATGLEQRWSLASERINGPDTVRVPSAEDQPHHSPPAIRRNFAKIKARFAEVSQ
jgi:hypothetical protein